MTVRGRSYRFAYRGLIWITMALLLGLTGCAPVAPPVGSMSDPSIPVAPAPDTRAVEPDTRQDARERIWATIRLRPEVIPGGPTFAGVGPDGGRLLSGVGCQFVVLNGGTVERQFGALRLTVEVTTKIDGHPVTNTFYLDTARFRVPAGGSTLLASAQLPSDGTGRFEYQMGGGWEGESWGRVYWGPLARQDDFVSVAIPSASLDAIDPTFGPSNKTFAITGCQLSA